MPFETLTQNEYGERNSEEIIYGKVLDIGCSENNELNSNVKRHFIQLF